MPFPLSLRAILLWSLALRVLFNTAGPLIDDEAYAIAVGRSFSLSFFDHPPIGFWLPAAMEAMFGGWPEVIYRLPALAFGTGAIWLLYRIGRELGGHNAGLWAAGLGAVTPFVEIYGTLMVPDAPLNFFLLATVLILLRLVRDPFAPLHVWACGGAMLGLAMASKYQAGLAPLAVVIWALATPAGRVWFRRPGFYLAVVLALAGLMPVAIWNLQHDWVSFGFHTGRPGGELSLVNFARMAVGQAVYLLPLMLFWALREIGGRANWADPQRRLLLVLALAPILMFNYLNLRGGDTLPHWSMAGYLCLIPLVALRLSQHPSPAWRWHLGMAAVYYSVLMLVQVQLSTGVLTRFADTPPTWERAAPQVSLANLHRAIADSGLTEGKAVLAADGWLQAGRIAAAMPDGPPMRVLNADPHHFAFMAGGTNGGPALLLEIADVPFAPARAAELLAMARGYDPAAQMLPSIPLSRAGQDQFRIIAIALTLP